MTETKNIADQIINLARAQVGVKELTRNDSPKIKQYLASVGLYSPQSWCMAFVYWVSANIGFKTPLFKSGGVLAVWNKTPEAYKSKTPGYGFIGIIDKGKGFGHTFYVSGINGINLKTIEGNTNLAGSSDADSCLELNRRKTTDKIAGYINLPQYLIDFNGIEQKKN